jgi:exodeoxyribonuclease-3
MRLISWNVNGIRAAIRHGFREWLSSDEPDIICLQETRIHDSQLTDGLRQFPGYHSHWASSDRKGYGGVATLCAGPLESVRKGFGVARFDVEGRVLITRHPSCTLVNAYFPSGRRSLERVEYKIDFYDTLLSFCSDLRTGGHPLVICGDFNTAHQPIDLARPKQNRKTSGFLPEERKALTRWLEAGFVDVFRHLNPDAQQYTWWTYRYDARARNVGWRLDYFLVADEFLSSVRAAKILGQVTGSDHCPIELDLQLH